MGIIAFFALCILIGIYQGAGWPGVAVAVAALCLAELLLLHVLPFVLRRLLLPFVFRLTTSSGKFQYLPPLEQGLRRTSQGFALMVLAVLSVVVPQLWSYGWHGIPALLPWAVNHPEDAWPLFVCAAFFIAGLIRFRAGVQIAAGARDNIKKSVAAVKCAVGVGVLAWLMLSYPPAQLAAFPGGFYAAMIAYAGGLWCALVGGMRFALLTMTVSRAPDRLAGHIAGQGTIWNPVGQKSPWWKF